ncbi:MAG TPA: hypothetical protein VIY96_10345 [Thermoanaerobaculia bacterium]
MRILKTGLLSLASLAVSSLLLANTRASVIDLTSNTILSTFSVGNNPQAVAWAGNTVAYVANDDGNSLVRLDMTTSPPTINETFFFPSGFEPHALAVNPAGTRALVTGDTTSAYLVNLANPMSIADTITVTLDANGVAFYSAGTKGIIVNEGVVRFLDLSTVPAGVTVVSLGNQGLDVSVNVAGTRAVVSIDNGGIQLVDLTTSPPSLMGGPTGPGLGTADPLGVAVSPDGTRAIYVDERIPASEANVMNITGLTPSLVNSVPIALFSPSAVAFNPVTAAALVHGDVGVAILNAPYTAVSATISFPAALAGATAHSIAVNPLGTRALVLHEDIFYCEPPEISFGNVPVSTTSPVTTVTCRNTGEFTISLNQVGVSGTGFALTGVPTVPMSIQPLGTVTFGVTFTPPGPGIQLGLADPSGTFGKGGFFNFGIDLVGNGVVAGTTPTPTPTLVPTSTATFTPIPQGPAAVVPTLSPGMLGILAVMLAGLGFFVARRSL